MNLNLVHVKRLWGALTSAHSTDSPANLSPTIGWYYYSYLLLLLPVILYCLLSWYKAHCDNMHIWQAYCDEIHIIKKSAHVEALLCNIEVHWPLRIRPPPHVGPLLNKKQKNTGQTCSIRYNHIISIAACYLFTRFFFISSVHVLLL